MGHHLAGHQVYKGGSAPITMRFPVLLAIFRGVTSLLGNVAGTQVAPSIGVSVGQKVAGAFAWCHGFHVPGCVKDSRLSNLCTYVNVYVYIIYKYLYGGTPKSSNLNRNFQDKLSISGYPHLWNPPSLQMYIYIYVYVCKYIYIYTYICMYVCICICICICI